MKKIWFVLSVLAMMVVVGCSTPTTDNSVEEEEVVTTPAPSTPKENPKPAKKVEDKSPFEYVKPDCVNLADYTYVGDYIFADSMNFAEWKYSNSETDYLLAFEKIARVKNDNPDTRLVRWDHYTWDYIDTTKATKYKIYAKTSVVESKSVNEDIINNNFVVTFQGGNGLEELYDGTALMITKKSENTFIIRGNNDNSTVLTDYVAY